MYQTLAWIACALGIAAALMAILFWLVGRAQNAFFDPSEYDDCP